MALLTAPDEPKALASGLPTAPVLRVRQRGAGQTRTTPLSLGKCTIGSSPQCQICLPTPEVRPLQCLITLESSAALVTRWATGVQLNGRDFNKAELHSGDRLTIGSWEIEFARGEFSPSESTRYEDEAAPEPLTQEPDALTPHRGRQTPLVALPEPAPGIAAAAAHVIQPPAAFERAPVVAAVSAESSNTAIHTSHGFADSLVLQLWTANYGARRRAKALITGIRAARFQADAMAADIAAMETELDLARAAYDSHLGNDDRVQHELAERRLEHEQRLGPLLEEVAALRSQLEEARGNLSRQTAEYSKLSAELAQLRKGPQAPAVDEQLVRHAAELEASVVAQSEKLEKLERELQSARQDQQRLAELYRVESERAAEFEQAVLQQRQSSVDLAAVSDEAPAAPSEPADTSNDLWAGVTPVVEEAAPVTVPASWDAFTPTADEVDSPSLEVASSTDEPASPPPAAEASYVVVEGISTDVAEAPVEPTEIQPPPLVENVPTPARDVDASASPAWAAPAEEKPAATTSFIDKYRHLLEDDDSASPLGLAPKGSRPVIDDEFLSPAKVETCASPADESDDALEAYMANMMRRVRSTSPSYESSQAVATPASTLTESKSAVANAARSSDQGRTAEETALSPDFLAEEPFSFEALKKATRKLPLASDLAALREIANSSARTAIATHSHKRSYESAVSKVAIGLTALASSAFLMASAPELNSWMFWGGAATGTIGIIAAVQVLLLERRRAANQKSS